MKLILLSGILLLMLANSQSLIVTKTIVSISRNTKVDPLKTDVCLDSNPTIEGANFILIPTVDDVVTPTSISTEVTGNCITFLWDIASYATKDVYLVVNTFEDGNTDPVAFAEIEVTLPPAFLGDIKAEIAVNPDKDPSETGNQKILRIEGDLMSFTIPDLGDPYEDTAKMVSYYFGEFLGNIFQPCHDSSTIPVCDITITAVDTPAIDSSIPVTTGVLKYDDESDSKATVSIEQSGLEKIDIIFKATTTADKLACVESQSCDIAWTAGEEEADIRLVTRSATAMTNYKRNPIQDHQLVAQALSLTTMEARWVKKTIDMFQLTSVDQSTSADVKTVIVDCSHLDSYCLAYITSMAQGTYSFRLKQYDETDIAKYAERQIESKSYPVGFPLSSEIQRVQMDLYEVEEGTNATVCFDHPTNNEGGAFSHYELVLVNEKSQWLSHKLLARDTSDRYCCSSFSIDTQDFDASESATLVVTQRAQDGFTVLASGETRLLVQF